MQHDRTMDDPPVRRARPDDAGRISEILRVGYDGLAPGPYLDYVLDPAQWMADATAALVAEVGDEVVGVVAFAVAGSPLHELVVPPMGDASFRFLAVDPRARGHGVGHRLVEACIDQARAAHARRLAIFTMDFMVAAQRLYPRLGFVRRPDLDVTFPGGIGLGLVRDLAPDAADHFAPPGPVPDEPPWYESVFHEPDDD